MPDKLRSALPLALLALASCAGAAVTTGGAGPQPGTAVSAPVEAPFVVTVQPGDTAYSLARTHGLSVEALLALNGLGGPGLRAGQVLRVREVPPYTVRPGETLYGLGRRFGVSVEALLAENALPPGAGLQAGQVLRVPRPAGGAAPTAQAPAAPGPASPAGDARLPAAPVVVSATPSAALPPPVSPPSLPAAEGPAPSPLPGDWRGAALALLGVPYVYGGTDRRGLDCSGFVLQVFAPLGLSLPRRSADQAQVGEPVTPGDLQPGDLVFFDTEGRGAVTHVGIYLGDDQFVNANSYRGQVVVDRLLADRYWGPKLLGARRVLPPAVYTLRR